MQNLKVICKTRVLNDGNWRLSSIHETQKKKKKKKNKKKKKEKKKNTASFLAAAILLFICKTIIN